MLHHQKAEDGNGKLNRGIERHFVLPEGDFDRWHYLAQVVQARAVAAGIEHWRSHWPVCAGTVVWQLNDCWPVSSWAAIDGDGHLKPLYHELRRVYADHVLSLVPADGGPVLVLDNQSGTPWRTTVVLRRLDADGTVLRESVLDLEADARTVVRLVVPDALLPEDGSSKEFLVADADGLRAVHFPVPDKEFAYPPADYDVRTEPGADGAVEVVVTARSLVRDLLLQADRLAPGAAADRGLTTLLPGEEVRITVTGWPGPTPPPCAVRSSVRERREGSRPARHHQRRRRPRRGVQGRRVPGVQRPPRRVSGDPERIFDAARELGWTPHQTARSLSRRRVGIVGLAICRPARLLGLEPFYMEFISGIEDVLTRRACSLLLRLVRDLDEETALYEVVAEPDDRQGHPGGLPAGGPSDPVPAGAGPARRGRRPPVPDRRLSLRVDRRRGGDGGGGAVPGGAGAPQGRPRRRTGGAGPQRDPCGGVRDGRGGTGPGRAAPGVDRVLRGGRGAGDPGPVAGTGPSDGDRLRQRHHGGRRGRRGVGDGAGGAGRRVAAGLGRLATVPAHPSSAVGHEP